MAWTQWPAWTPPRARASKIASRRFARSSGRSAELAVSNGLENGLLPRRFVIRAPLPGTRRPPTRPSEHSGDGRHRDAAHHERVDQDSDAEHEAGLDDGSDAGEQQPEHRGGEDEARG